MANFQELEVKILDIDIVCMKKKLEEIGAEFKKEVMQKIYTYDCYPPKLMYQLALNDYKITNSKNSLLKIANMYSYIEPIVTEDEKKIIREICQFDSLNEYIKNNIDNINLNILENEDICKIIEESNNRFFKWIRLRQNGDKAELTIKYIYSTDEEYEIDKVREYEVNVSDFIVANRIVEEMGYFRKKYVEKKRMTYQYDGVKIEIDEWPLIKPYIEIEGDSVEKIYEIVNKLGYTKEDTKIMNTEDVYLRQGIDLNSFEELKFNN